MNAIPKRTTLDSARHISELCAEILECVNQNRERDLTPFDEEETCARCGKPTALGACVESDCPLEGE